MRGYKVFNPDWTCRGFQYEVGKTYEMEDKPECCEVGFHFCKELIDCFQYYPFNPSNKVAIVEALEDIDEKTNDSKCCTNKIKIVEELSWEKVLKLVNSGDGNSGNRNSGDGNSGNRNSGNRNSGDGNSGDWNVTNYSNGCFNTKEPNIFIFNKLSDLTYVDWINSDVRYLLNNIPIDELIWVYESRMTDEEKENNPEYKTTGGYLKSIKATNKNKQEWYDCLSNENKRLILNMPNFDKKIFKEITGIDVGEI